MTDWEDRIPGVWLATVEGQPGEEMWTFNGRTMIANRQYWPRGFGVTNPLDNGVAAPLQISKSWSVDGDTLTVTSAFRESVYENLRVDNTRCFSADLDGSRVQFCRLRI